MSLVLRAPLVKNLPGLLCRSFHASSAVQEKSQQSRLMFNLAGYNKYGLLRDDLLSEWDENVVEAVRRLPEEEQMQRLYRAIRANCYEVNNSILPQEEWTKYEDNHYYLQPYIKEVIAEREERKEWEATH